MKLLDKKLVNASLATERKTQIDTGIRIAQKVDAVRETLLKEEKRLADFRKESVAYIQTEIDAKLREKTNLNLEIMKRRSELAELRKPLDAAWQEVKAASGAIEKHQQSLMEKQHELEHGIALNIQRERDNKDEVQRLAQERKLTDDARFTAEQAKDDAINNLMESRAEASVILERAREREEAIAVREKEIAEREKENESVRKQQSARRKEQDEKDKEIQDKYKTLERTLNRFKK